MKIVYFTIILIQTASFLASCGDATVVTANESYEQRIVIEGYLQAGRNIERIYITRNFPVTTNLSKISLIPDPDKTTVQITDLENNQRYPLTFKVDNPENLKDIYWTYDGSDFVVQEGKRYQLEVWTTIGGKSLFASSVTTVPNSGFEIISLNHQQLDYRERDLNDNLKEFQVELNRSVGTTYYAATVQALNPSLETFIYDNPYDDIKPEDVDLIDDALSYEILHHAAETAGVSQLTFGWHVFNFYDRYRIVIFAADQNYKDFFMTYGNVMEMDGNFHEAKFNIEGDGIGVFGSVIADTVFVEVVR